MKDIGGIKLSLGLLALAALPLMSSFAREKDRSFSLRFIPQESISASAPERSGGLLGRPFVLEFEDARTLADRSVVGEGTSDDDAPFTYRSTIPIDVFVRSTMRQIVAGWGFPVSEEADDRLAVKLSRFFVSEKDQAMGSTYFAEARLSFTLYGPSGEVLAQGSGSGEARRYGKDRSSENCNEVLSDAFKEALATMLDEQSLHSTLVTKSSAASDLLRSPEGSSPDELLRELVKLRDEGFSEPVLMEYLVRQRFRTPLGADDMLKWKKAGLSEDVIRLAMKQSTPR